MSRRADVTCGNHFANGRWKNRDLAGNACPFLGLAWSDMPTGTTNAKSSALSRRHPHGRNGICRRGSIRRIAEGRGPQHRARAWRFRRSDELAARRRYPYEEGLQRHAGRESAHLARRGCRCHQTGAGEAGRQDRSRRAFMGWRGHHASRRRSQGFGAGLRLRVRTQRRRIPGVARQGRSADRRRQRDPSRREGQPVHRPQNISFGGRG